MGLNFDGVADIVTGGTPSALSNLSALSATCWMNRDSMGEGSIGHIFCKSLGDAVSSGWKLSMEASALGNGNVYFRVDYDVSDLRRRTNVTNFISASAWHFVVVTWTGSGTSTTAKIYCDTVEASAYDVSFSGSTSRLDDSATPILLGNTVSLSRTFDGRLEDMRIYNRVLSQAEIDTMYATMGKDGIVSGLVSRYFMREGAPGVSASGAGVIKDLSETQSNGTPASSPPWFDNYVTDRRRAS